MLASLVVTLRYPILAAWVAAAVLAVVYLPSVAAGSATGSEELLSLIHI